MSSVPIIQGRIVPNATSSDRDGVSVHSNASHSGMSAASINNTLTAPTLGNGRSLSNVTVSATQSDVSRGLLYPDFPP